MYVCIIDIIIDGEILYTYNAVMFLTCSYNLCVFYIIK